MFEMSSCHVFFTALTFKLQERCKVDTVIESRKYSNVLAAIDYFQLQDRSIFLPNIELKIEYPHRELLFISQKYHNGQFMLPRSAILIYHTM